MAQVAICSDPGVKLGGGVTWWHGLMPYKRNMKTVTMRQIGNTLFVVTAECAADATETVQAKLERLMSRRLSEANSYPANRGIPLAF